MRHLLLSKLLLLLPQKLLPTPPLVLLTLLPAPPLVLPTLLLALPTQWPVLLTLLPTLPRLPLTPPRLLLTLLPSNACAAWGRFTGPMPGKKALLLWSRAFFLCAGPAWAHMKKATAGELTGGGLA